MFEMVHSWMEILSMWHKVVVFINVGPNTFSCHKMICKMKWGTSDFSSWFDTECALTFWPYKMLQGNNKVWKFATQALIVTLALSIMGFEFFKLATWSTYLCSNCPPWRCGGVCTSHIKQSCLKGEIKVIPCFTTYFSSSIHISLCSSPSSMFVIIFQVSRAFNVWFYFS